MITHSKVALSLFGLTLAIIAGYIGYLTLTYIDEYEIVGNAYGFKIGSSKKQTIENIKKLKKEYPNLAIHITYGPQAGDMKTIKLIDNAYSEVATNDDWWLLLDNTSEFKFHNIIRLTFEEQYLTVIHRKRQNFELP